MTKITLLGDSIRLLGYGTRVPALLGDDFHVFQPEDNCRFCKYTLRGLYDWREDMEGSRIVHWNNGIWDVCRLYGDGLFTSEDEYLTNMLRIATLLQKKHEKVIFATTTPVRENALGILNDDVVKYNRLLVPELQKQGILINDLYSTVLPVLDACIRQDDGVHLTEEGIAVCAAQVAEVITKAANC